jgi:3-deoxy-7-phosphoheptulonate synthase
MSIRTDDIRIDSIHQLISPAILMQDTPVSEEMARLVANTREQSEAILHGKDDRLLVVVGPCSIHDTDAALDYAAKLKEYADGATEDLLIIMRVYFEKPRTTVGWKGLINDPNLDGTFDINHGLGVARELLVKLTEMGMPAGTEFLDTISPQYVADLVSWGAIGARTTESQIHRELASGLSAPVGFKNGTGGSIQIALDAIQAGQKPHHFLSVTKQGTSAIVATTGNSCCHLILRGSGDGPNFDHDSIRAVRKRLKEADLPLQLMVDCSHGNSCKDYRKQPDVAADLCQQLADGETSIAAVMIESNLVEGNQKLGTGAEGLEYGQSITDACVSWDTTVQMLDQFAGAVRKRRKTYLA